MRGDTKKYKKGGFYRKIFLNVKLERALKNSIVFFLRGGGGLEGLD